MPLHFVVLLKVNIIMYFVVQVKTF